ncbi:hypothetical protein EV356DRAFT_513347 [Viridothelium virens]|uniref:Histone transcription regulator 3 homolog n=1 Tax=Viridothelium virens TaxID=1048519 RepID=A0A6A6HDN3_VIRVR|nr:hypothetical protein EV356DRAFT_513347 [Viridothelium virens]
MASFRALNIESDDESDDEIDDTKEVQIEEALKLYQTALKYHSQGPQSYDKAGDAYRALFESEIFRYPESLSELRRYQLYEAPPEDALRPYDAAQKTAVVATGSGESAPSTLPQILHLSYKNHGEYWLELLRSGIGKTTGDGRDTGAVNFTYGQPSATAAAALEYFVEALDKDGTDLDLWRRTSSITSLLGSQRTARYCLEALLDKHARGTGGPLTLPGIQDSLAASDYAKITKAIGDDMFKSRETKIRLRASKLAAALDRPLESMNEVAARLGHFAKGRVSLSDPTAAPRLALGPLRSDWVEVGEALLRQFLMEKDGVIDTSSSSGIFLEIFPEPLLQNSGEVHLVNPQAQQKKEIDAGSLISPVAVPPTSAVSTSEQVQDDQKDDDHKSVNEFKNEEGNKDPSEAKDGSNRKRSHDSAGLEGNEGTRARSKRIRARDSVTEGTSATEEAAVDPWKHFEQQLEPYIQADDILFDTLGILLQKIGLDDIPRAQKLREMAYFERDNSLPPDSAASSSSSDRNFNTAVSDFQSAVRIRANDLARMLLAAGDVIDELGSTSPQAGLAAILGHAKRSSTKTTSKTLLVGGEGLGHFSRDINTKWTHIQEAALGWVQYFLKPGYFPGLEGLTTSYTMHLWSDPLKALVVRIIVNLDEFIFASMLENFELKVAADDAHASLERQRSVEMVQALFELHLDVYSLIKHPGSGVDLTTQTLQKERLARWSELAQCSLEQTSYRDDQFSDQQTLRLRHLWATAFHLSVCDGVPQDHVLLCLEDLKKTIKDCGSPMIDLQNNAIMPEISVSAVAREISRLTTKDFFIKVFDPYQSDPVTVIESLEPVLEASLAGRSLTASSEYYDNGGSAIAEVVDGVNGSKLHQALSPDVHVSPIFDELFKFLESGSISVKLSLWQRLREAYEAIDYPSKIMSCYLRSIECLVRELSLPSHRESAQDQRHFTLIKMLRMLDELCVRVLIITDGNREAFECVDIDHVQSSFQALMFFTELLHTFTMYHDAVKIGQLQPPQGENGAPSILPMLASRIQDMQVRLWKLQYILFSEGLVQSATPSLTPLDDKFDFLRVVHRATGIRGFCKGSHRTFLRLLRKEMLQISHVQDFESEFAQVLFDLYGLDVFPSNHLKEDHACAPEPLDRKTALALLDFVLTQASRINIKELTKTELKNAIEKIHGSLPKNKPSEGMNRNRAVYRAKMKMPIQPLSLFQCLDGIGGLPTVPVSPHEAPAASKGWYFLMGQMALTRFRSQKRVGAVPTEDVMLAIAFFVQDIEYSAEKWETWYRLAQAYDVQVEESVLWSAEGLNNNSQDIVQNQRAAIHCYTLAVALSIQSADFSFETSSKIADLYADFGTRLYSSSREPFSMAAFSVDEFERTFSGEVIYKKSPFQALQPYIAWRLASAMFRRAIMGKPENWSNHYMLGKCLWKMHCVEEGGSKVPTVYAVLDAFIKAIKALPERRDGRQYPILEPHYKLVSIVHKMVERSELDLAEAVRALSDTTQYAQGVSPPDDREAWNTYVLQVLKNMRVADKSNWHHRMTARAATIIYQSGDDETATNAAKSELMQQIFTKTMTVQVWKPENERPGRHFVYTTRYSTFFVQLLVQSGDRANLEALAKRLRRKPNDFLNHTKLWQDVCQNYLRLLRRAADVPEGHEDAIFKSVSHEDFQKRATRIETWSRQPSTNHLLLDVLRETIELKRLNNSLMKSTLIDDLIGDAYALLYDTIGQELDAAALTPTPTETPAVPPLPPPPPPPPPKEKESVMSLSNMMNNTDGANDTADTATPTPSIPPATAAAVPADQAAKPARVRGVGRREIRQAAEAATTQKPIVLAAAPSTAAAQSKPAVVPTPSSTSATATPGTTTTMAAVEIPARSQAVVEIRGAAEGGRQGEKEKEKDKEREKEKEKDKEKVEESAPGSVHDSADDESELSELVEEGEEEEDDEEGEEIIVRPLFPGLASKDGASGGNGKNGGQEGGKGSGE